VQVRQKWLPAFGLITQALNSPARGRENPPARGDGGRNPPL